MRALVRGWVAIVALASFAAVDVRPARADTVGLAPGMPPPPQTPAQGERTKVHRRRVGLVATGAVVFGLSYGGALFLSALAINSRCCSRDMALDFAIPIFGPIAGGPSADSEIMIAWSASQLGGALMLMYGLKGEDVDAAPTAAPPARGTAGTSMRLVPLVAHDAGGMILTGRW